jgi:hypothetical protein
MILYGRNDAHGYNLHKRAAISLNALAEVLEDPDDEIIFVDYNTPDELPTFLETIADTLTERAKRYIRIIRVRPEFHRQYRHVTHLVALESQSRNIAIRRANPANRWILSTNTDMIFAPEKREETLTGIVGQLSDGFYHLPRFEVPEGFWERSNRLDPQGMIEQMRTFGKRYHLNEVVYGGFDNVYEAPGDFQLFLRDDLNKVCGFDETMLKGWHVDTNMARRMKFLRGKVETLFPQIYGYHCGHTRQATSLHGARRTENSLDTYVRDIRTPYWTTNDAWGAPDKDFEEVFLTQSRTSNYLAALDLAITGSVFSYSEATYNETTYCEEGFDAAHVLPHLGDILFNMPPGRIVFMVGSDLELIRGFGRFINSAPMSAELLVCAELGLALGCVDDDALDLESGLARADIVVIQYPNARTVCASKRADLEWFAQHALERFIELERGREKSERRRVVVVNGMHSRLQDLIGASLDAAAAPFSARIRQGRVLDQTWDLHPAIGRGSSDRAAYDAVGRSRAFAPSEIATLARLMSDASSQISSAFERAAIDIMALAAVPDFLANRVGLGNEITRHAATKARASVVAAASRCVTSPIALAARPDAPNRLCSGADWEDDDWLKLAVRYFGERSYTIGTRSRWLWERISLLHQLRQRVSRESRAWILCVADGPEPLAAMAAHQGYRVAYATADAILTNQTTANWFNDFQLSNIVLPGSLMPLDQAPADIRFAALIAPSACLFSHDSERPRNVMACVASRMVSDAHCGMSSLVHLNSSQGGGALSERDFRDACGERGILQQIGLRGDAPVDARIPLDTAVRFAQDDQDSEWGPGLSFGYGSESNVSIGMLWGRFRTITSGEPLPVENLSAPAARAIVVEPVQPVVAKAPQASALAAHHNDTPRARTLADAWRSHVLFYPTVYQSLRRNILPSVVSHEVGKRSTLSITLHAGTDGRVRFGAPIANFFPAVCVMHLGVTDAAAKPTALFVGSQGVTDGAVAGKDGIFIVKFQSTESLGDGMAVLEFSIATLEISVLSVTCEAMILDGSQI